MTLPTGPDHDRWADASGAYVLGALPADEAEGYAAHLEVCAACRAEVEELEPAAAALPASAPPVSAPAAIRERVMVEVRREAALLAAAGPHADRAPRAEPRRRRSWLRLPVPALVAAALLVGLAVGLGVGALGGDGERTVAVATAGAAKGAHASLVVGDGFSTLEADHLPPPPAGRVYQVWLQPHDGSPQPTDVLFVPRADGTATIGVPGDVAGQKAVLVSTEPTGGSAMPTTQPILTAAMS